MKIEKSEVNNKPWYAIHVGEIFEMGSCFHIKVNDTDSFNVNNSFLHKNIETIYSATKYRVVQAKLVVE